MFIVVTLAVIGVAALTYAAVSYFRGDSGWHTIELSSGSDATLSDEIRVEYCLGAEGRTAYAERRELISIYSDALWYAEKLFDCKTGYIDLNNMFYINNHINEVIEVPEYLYNIFVLMEKYSDRHIYLGPLYGDYSSLMYSATDEEAAMYDPAYSESQAEYVARIAAFASDKDSVNIELMSDNRIVLRVSEEYASYAADMEIVNYIDFYWMRNAFVVDYVADALEAAGYTNGFVISYDGYLRNLNGRGEEYAYQLVDRKGNEIRNVGTLLYTKPLSAVMFKNFGLNSKETQHYYEYADGTISHVYVDVSDGMCKSSLNNLLVYSYQKSCGEMLLASANAYIADTFDVSVLDVNDMYHLYFDGTCLITNDTGIRLSDLKEGYTVK